MFKHATYARQNFGLKSQPSDLGKIKIPELSMWVLFFADCDGIQCSLDPTGFSVTYAIW